MVSRDDASEPSDGCKSIQRRTIADERSAKTIWALYLEYGLGKFSNWLTMKHDNIYREEVIDALRFAVVREAAAKQIDRYLFKIDELRSMIAESEREQ